MHRDRLAGALAAVCSAKPEPREGHLVKAFRQTLESGVIAKAVVDARRRDGVGPGRWERLSQPVVGASWRWIPTEHADPADPRLQVPLPPPAPEPGSGVRSEAPARPQALSEDDRATLKRLLSTLTPLEVVLEISRARPGPAPEINAQGRRCWSRSFAPEPETLRRKPTVS